MKLKINDIITLKNSEGLCDKPQEKREKYLNINVTIKKIFPNRKKGESDNEYLIRIEEQEEFSLKEIETFFIKEDGGNFEWIPDDIK